MIEALHSVITVMAECVDQQPDLSVLVGCFIKHFPCRTPQGLLGNIDLVQIQNCRCMMLWRVCTLSITLQ